MEKSKFEELERQAEEGNLFAHTVLTEQIIRQNESDAFLYGLIDYLSQKGIVIPDELLQQVQAVKKEILEKKDYAKLGVVIRVDSETEEQPFVPVNCSERLHICKAVCCKLSFPLSIKEIESGTLKWEMGKPYRIRHQSNGYCCHIENMDKKCSLYESRPSVCKKYSCANDARIWTDFERMILNDKWLEENLGKEKLSLMNVYI